MTNAIDLALRQGATDSAHIKFEHVKLDASGGDAGEWSTSVEQQNAEAAVADPSALAYIGPYSSGAASVSLPITNRAGLLQIGLSQTWPGLTLDGWNPDEPERYFPSGTRYYVRLSPNDTVQVLAAARWSYDAGARSVMVLHDGSSYSKGLGEIFQSAAPKAGISIRGFYGLDFTNPNRVASEINRLRPDAVFYAPSSVNQAITLSRAIERMGLRVGVFATDTALSDQFADSLKQSSQKWRVVFNGAVDFPNTPEAVSFRRDYKEAFGGEPGLYAAYAYDAASLVLRSARSVSPITRAAVAERVKGTADYAGTSGTITFDVNGDRLGWRVTGYQLNDRLFTLYRVIVSP